MHSVGSKVEKQSGMRLAEESYGWHFGNRTLIPIWAGFPFLMRGGPHGLTACKSAAFVFCRNQDRKGKAMRPNARYLRTKDATGAREAK
jgi:hypothetical protein